MVGRSYSVGRDSRKAMAAAVASGVQRARSSATRSSVDGMLFWRSISPPRRDAMPPGEGRQEKICPGPRPLFDQAIGARDEVAGPFDAELLGSAQIDDEVELPRMLDRQLAGLRTVENLVDVAGAASPEIG